MEEWVGLGWAGLARARRTRTRVCVLSILFMERLGRLCKTYI